MFNLEIAIAEWRQQMLVAGIKTPVPLEELESHLREEIGQQLKSGVNEQMAFEIAAQQIGQASALKKEFNKAHPTMKTKYISQRFISSMHVIFSVASLAMLLLQFMTPAIHAARLAGAFKSSKISLLDLYATFNGNSLLDHTNFACECLVLSLILTVLFALLRFCLSKPSRESRNV
jgi:hypothetical protein